MLGAIDLDNECLNWIYIRKRILIDVEELRWKTSFSERKQKSFYTFFNSRESFQENTKTVNLSKVYR
jgi:hypothetical protein